MKAKILYLYYDIMNLYGENGNIRMMERVLASKGVKVETDRKTVTDTDIDFAQHDFIYCGAGTERSRNVCLEHLRGFADSLKKAFESGTVMLFTGNSYEMLGKSIVVTDRDESLEGIGLLNFTVTEQRKNRYSGDVTLRSDVCDGQFIGYINKCSRIDSVEKPLFEILSVVGTVTDKFDGIHEKNFFGTQVIGPVTVKNPAFGEYIADLIIENLKK